MAWLETGGANTSPLSLANWLGTSDAVPLIIRTQGTEVMRITPATGGGATGVTGMTRLLSVGIGTDQPRAKLHVSMSDPFAPSIHAGGSSAALSFASQTYQPSWPDFWADGGPGARWEWLARSDDGGRTGSARLWSGGDKLIITGLHGQVLLTGDWLLDGRDFRVLYPGVPIGTLTPDTSLIPAPPPTPPAPGELVLGGIRTSIRGFDGEKEDTTKQDGLSLRLGNHWIRTNGHEAELWMSFRRQRAFSLLLGRSMQAAVTWFGPGFEKTSDERLKMNVRQVEGALDKLERIRGAAFEWAEPESPYGLGGVPGQSGIGVIAQEVEQVFPEVVSIYDAEHEYKAVDYNGLTGVLIEAVKELKAQNEALQSRIEALERA